jgi:midasin (ATPase involved in ribosome maturation)
LNLAAQSVLDWLNAVLDHRRSVFGRELEQELCAAHGFCIFGAQNAAYDGGGDGAFPEVS